MRYINRRSNHFTELQLDVFIFFLQFFFETSDISIFIFVNFHLWKLSFSLNSSNLDNYTLTYIYINK